MNSSENNTEQSGDGSFEFSDWETPFSNAEVEILEILYSPKWQDDDDSAPSRYQRLTPTPDNCDLVIWIFAFEQEAVFRVAFNQVAAFRLMDESGLHQLWEKSRELGGRPAHATFRVRNYHWTRESQIPFFMGTNEGWVFVIASGGDCLEILAREEPIIEKESG